MVFGTTKKNPSVFFVTQKNAGIFYIPKKVYFGQNFSAKKVLQTPQSLKYLSGMPGSSIALSKSYSKHQLCTLPIGLIKFFNLELIKPHASLAGRLLWLKLFMTTI